MPGLRLFPLASKLKASGATYGYGYNLYLSAPPLDKPVTPTRVGTPSLTTLFADAAQVNTWQSPASPDHPMIEEWYFVDDNTNQPNCHFRHNKRANVAFCDGHIATEKFITGSLNQRMPAQFVGTLRSEILSLR